MRILAAVVPALLAAQEAPPPAEAPSGEPPAAVLTRAPELVEFVPAEYPPEAEAAGIQGSVVLSIVVDEDGGVRQAVVLDPGPHEALAAAALHAVQQFVFRPAEIDGVPAAVEIEYRYDFVLRRPEPPPAPAEAPISLLGRVLERGTRTPVAAATVESQGAVAETDAEGRFTLRGVAPGEVFVRVLSTEHEPIAFAETIEEGRAREVEYRLRRRRYDPYEAVVRGERPREEVTVHSLSTEEIRTMSGTQGDTLRVVQNLPGVARAPFGIGLLVVRGSEPNETVVYVDGVPIPLLFHLGFFTSVVNSDVIDTIDFFPGNFGPRFGRALGGTVELKTRDPRREWHGAAQVDVLDGRVQVEGPAGPGSFYAAVRRSWLDAALAIVLPRVDPDAANDLRVAPRYYDYQAKLSLPVLGGVGTVFAYGSDDLLTFVQEEDRPGRPTFHLSTLFHRGGFSWRKPLGALTNDLVLAAGRDSFDVLQGSAFGLLTEVRTVSLRDALSGRLAEGLTFEAGVDALLRRLEYSVYAAPPESPGTVGDEFTETPTTVSEEDAGWWLAPALHARLDWSPSPSLRLSGGLRLEVERRLGRTVTWLDPRLSLHWDVHPRTTLYAGASLHGSTPEPAETSPTFGNPGLDPERAAHLALGIRQELPFGARLEATAFYKRLWSLVVPTLAVDGDGVPLNYSNEGRGRGFGLELLLRRELAKGLYGWLAWTWSRAERIGDPSVSPHGWQLFPLDQTHVLALLLSYRLPGDWILGTRLRAVSGNPITPFEGHFLDADSGRVQCLPGARLSERLPAFFQADARLDRRFVFDSWMLTAYLDVLNVTNRENAEFRFRSWDCAQTVPLPSIPIFPTFGLRAEW